MSDDRPTRECPKCHRLIMVVNHGWDRESEVGYLGRHTRKGIPETSKCSGSFGAWVGK